MSRKVAVAIGLRVHSGWAALVALAGPITAPSVVERRRIEMADDPEARQPYHAAEELPLKRAAALLDRFSRQALERAANGLGEVLERLRSEGHDAVGAVLLTAAGRTLPALESVLASHALIHTADGEHFRDALAAAGARHDLPVVRIRERDLLARAQDGLGRPGQSLLATVSAWGKPLGPPWTQDQKLSALAAWLGLAGTFPTRT
jgi:hypothetical protein